MSDSIVPVTYINTTHSGVMASAAVGKGRVEIEHYERTVYPNGLSVTNIYHHTVEVYDAQARVSQHNQPHTIDQMV